MNLEDLQKKIDDNAKKINDNLSKIENNSDKINNNAKKIHENSYALEILKDYKVGFNRWHTMALVFLILWVLTICYLVYILNNPKTIEPSIDYEAIEYSDIVE